MPTLAPEFLDDLTLDKKFEWSMLAGAIIVIGINILILSSFQNSFSLIIFLQLAIAVFCSIWCSYRARKLNRSRVIWGIAGFIFSPLTLMILCFLQPYIEDDIIRNIVSEKRKAFAEKINKVGEESLAENERNVIRKKVTLEMRNEISTYVDRMPEKSAVLSAGDVLFKSNVSEEELQLLMLKKKKQLILYLIILLVILLCFVLYLVFV